MAKIILKNISERQKLTIKKCMLDYDYIMKNWKTNSKDFQDVYYDFYLKARWSRYNATKRNERKKYFRRLSITKPTDKLEDIIKDLGGNEFSLASKLLHTVNPNMPIYDSKVRKYLIDIGIRLRKTTPKIIKNDWESLTNWYATFLKSQEGKDWIDWFDKEFPTYRSISNVKKIDTIIFATQ